MITWAIVHLAKNTGYDVPGIAFFAAMIADVSCFAALSDALRECR